MKESRLREIVKEEIKSVVTENAELEDIIKKAAKEYNLDYKATKDVFTALFKSKIGSGLLKLVKFDLRRFKN